MKAYNHTSHFLAPFMMRDWWITRRKRLYGNVSLMCHMDFSETPFCAIVSWHTPMPVRQTIATGHSYTTFDICFPFHLLPENIRWFIGDGDFESCNITRRPTGCAGSLRWSGSMWRQRLRCLLAHPLQKSIRTSRASLLLDKNTRNACAGFRT